MVDKDRQVQARKTTGSFWLTTFLIIAALALLFSGFILRETFQHSRRNIETALTTLTRSVDEKLESVDTRMQQLIQSDLKARAFFINNIKREDYYDLYLFFQDLYNTVVLDETLHSLYAYRRSDDLVISTAYIHTSKLSDFGDQDFLLTVDEGYKAAHSPVQSVLDAYKRVSPLRLVDGQSVMSISNCYPIYSNRYGWLVANVSAKALKNYIGALVNDTGAEIEVSDQAGSVLFSTFQEGGGRYSIEGERLSAYSGLRFKARQRTTLAGYFITKGYFVLIALGVFMLLVCAYRILAFTKNETMPLDRIKGEMKLFFGAETAPNDSGRKTPPLESSFAQLLTEARKYRGKYDEWRVLKRQDFINLLLSSSENLSQEELNEYCQYDDVSFLRGAVTLAVICAIDEETDPNTQLADPEYLPNTLEKAHEYMGSQYLMQRRSAAETVLITEMAPLEVQQLLSYINGNLVPLSMAVSDYVFDYRQIAACYAELNSMQRYRMVLDNPFIITRQRFNLLDRANSIEIYAAVQELNGAITRFDPEWEEKLELLRSRMEASLLTEENIRQIVHGLLGNLHESLKIIGQEFQTEFRRSVVEVYTLQEGSLRTLSSVLDALKALLSEYMLWAGDNQRNSSRHALMRRIEQYIDGEIGNDQLSLQSISAYFNMNASSFSTVFKKLFGEKFVDYVIRLRIERSCMLLKDPAVTVEAVARSVGYANAASFSRVFKKETGRSPSEYRTMNQEPGSAQA